MSQSEKPNSISQQTYEQAGASGVDVYEEDGQLKAFDQGGYIFPRLVTPLDPATAEETLQDALQHPYPDPSWNKR